jgi:hypothetical protein
MFSEVNLEAPETPIRDNWTVPPSSAVCKAYPCHMVFGTIHRIFSPPDSNSAVINTSHGIAIRRWWIVIFITDHCAIIVLKSDLPPADISTKESDIASVGDEGFDIISHLLRPILVVADTEEQVIVVEKMGIRMEINATTVFKLETIGLRPSNEFQLIPSGRISTSPFRIRTIKGDLRGTRVTV